jgi:hypothetical protein
MAGPERLMGFQPFQVLQFQRQAQQDVPGLGGARRCGPVVLMGGPSAMGLLDSIISANPTNCRVPWHGFGYAIQWR